MSYLVPSTHLSLLLSTLIIYKPMQSLLFTVQAGCLGGSRSMTEFSMISMHVYIYLSLYLKPAQNHSIVCLYASPYTHWSPLFLCPFCFHVIYILSICESKHTILSFVLSWSSILTNSSLQILPLLLSHDIYVI